MNDSVLLSLKFKNKNKDFSDFVEYIHETSLLDDFELGMISYPVYALSDEILEHILKNGLSSLYHYSVLLEDVLSPTINIDKIEDIILKFISKLDGVKKLAIIDPYFFAGKPNQNNVMMFERFIKCISSNLKEVVFVTNNIMDNKRAIFEVIPSNIERNCIVSDVIHDRFWIDVDSYKGIVMGTSFNGIGKKLALIDFLKETDAKDIIDTLKGINDLI